MNFENMRIFCGSQHPELGQEIAKQMGLDLGKIELSRFSCNESYARVAEPIRGRDCYILQSIGDKPNDGYMELFLIMDALKRASAATVNVVIPHFGYARQDKKSAPREPISARMIADLLTAVGMNRIICMDLHADQIQGFFSCPVDHLTAMPLFIDYFKKKNFTDLIVVAPDAGRAKFAKKLGDKLGAELAILHKTRPNHNVAEITNIVGDVKNKTVLLVDDMVDTGGSVTTGVKTLRDCGCNPDIYLATTHAVFSGPAVERFKETGFKEVVVTNSMPIPMAKRFEGLVILSAAPLMAEVIRRNYDKQSISPLFN